MESLKEIRAAIRKPEYVYNNTARLQLILKSVKHKKSDESLFVSCHCILYSGMWFMPLKYSLVNTEHEKKLPLQIMISR